MKPARQRERLKRRQAAFDDDKTGQRTMQGFKRPGSIKKKAPKGRH